MEPDAFDELAQAAGDRRRMRRPGQAGLAVFNTQRLRRLPHLRRRPKSNGTVGPDLDELAADAKKAGKPLEDFIRESIVDPNNYIAPGYPPNVMPQTFAIAPEGAARRLVVVPREASQKGS